MKHLGVRVKEPRNLESKRGLNRLFPKMKVPRVLLAYQTFSFTFNKHVTLCLLLFFKHKSIKTDKEVDDRLKKKFLNLVPQRRPSRIEAAGKCLILGVCVFWRLSDLVETICNHTYNFFTANCQNIFIWKLTYIKNTIPFGRLWFVWLCIFGQSCNDFLLFFWIRF